MHTFCTIVQIVNCQQIFVKSDPNLTFTFCPNRKSKFNILKNHISTTARGKFTIFAPLYRSLIVIKYVFKIYPNLTFSSSRTPFFLILIFFICFILFLNYFIRPQQNKTTKNTEQSKQLHISETNDIQAQNTQQHY